MVERLTKETDKAWQKLSARRSPLLTTSTILRATQKKHDIGKIIESILLHGFFQTILVCKRQNSVLGGNGRLESLIWLKQYPQDAENIAKELKARYGPKTEINYPPGGITVKNGQWFVNVLEVETVSDAEAIAINLQDNFSVLDGGDFTALDKTKAFEVDALLEQLETLRVDNFLPVSVDSDDLDLMLRELEERNNDGDPGWNDEPESSTKEIDVDAFEFDCECPKCGFQFTKITK